VISEKEKHGMVGAGFENWNWITDPKSQVYKFPRKNQPVLVRTVDNEIWVMIYRLSTPDDVRGCMYFEIATYSGNFRLADWPINSVLQWTEIPGFESLPPYPEIPSEKWDTN
jgi:hypothetical protein